MTGDRFSLAVGSWALALGIVALIAVCAALMPLRWGWKAFPFAVLVSAVTTAMLVLASVGILYENGGGFVVHFNALHLTAACVLGAAAFWSIRKTRSDGMKG